MIGNNTEKEFRDNQKSFGHTSKPLDLKSWLKDTYSPNNSKYERYKNVADTFLQSGDKAMEVLEVGAGVGDFVTFCSSLYPRNAYYANDLSDGQLGGNISEVMDYFKVKKQPELSFGPVESLNYPDDKFDLVFVKASIHHFENPVVGLSEIRRVLKEGGRLVFIEDPICWNIPFYQSYVKKNFCLSERSMGINEHIYTIKDYLYFGTKFSKKEYYVDKELVKEFDRQQEKRSGLKKAFGRMIRANDFLFRLYMVKRFRSPLIFVYTK